MKFDFETYMDRHNHDAIAIDAIGCPDFGICAPKEGFEPIPMWVADMNFVACPSVIAKMQERLSHPAFGYFTPSKEYYDSIISWHKIRNGVEGLDKAHIGYENGVLGGVASALSVLCSRGDKVLLHSPTYIGFTGTLKNNGYSIVHSPLVIDENQVYRMDFEDMEKRIIKHKIHVLVFCSPHNPCGRVWERWELEKLSALCEKHGVYIISDEIWSDILLDGHKHIPTQSVSDYAKNHTVAIYAPSKTFNVAGLIGSYHIIYNKVLKERIDKESSLCHYNSMNVLSMHALIGAYQEEGHLWCDELCEVLSTNVAYACDFIANNFKGVKVCKPQGTYMLFLDCSDYLSAQNLTLDDLLKRAHDVGVCFQDGRGFNGQTHIRVNLALPLFKMREAFDRLKQYVFVD